MSKLDLRLLDPVTFISKFGVGIQSKLLLKIAH